MAALGVRRFPRVMPLARAAKEILSIDPHEGYRLAREGKIQGAFKVGNLWFVSTLTMIRGMQDDAEAIDGDDGEDEEEFSDLLDDM